jgi:hypothetical protein
VPECAKTLLFTGLSVISRFRVILQKIGSIALYCGIYCGNRSIHKHRTVKFA